MINFIVTGGLLVLSTLLVFWLIFTNKRASTQFTDSEDARRATNLAIAKRQLSELEKQRPFLSEHEYANQMKDLELKLLNDLNDDPNDLPPLDGSDTDHRSSNHADSHANNHGRFNPLALSLLAIVIVSVSSAMYMFTGSPSAIDRPSMTIPTQGTDNNALPPLSEMISALEARLQSHPDDPDQWALAARTYMAMNRFSDADNAYAKLHKLTGDDADVLAAWSDASVMANNREFSPGVVQRLERALQLAPNHINALWLMALAKSSQGDSQGVLAYGQRLLLLVGEDEAARQQIESMIAYEKTRLSARNTTESKSTSSVTATADKVPHSITIQVTLAEKLRRHINADDRVFIFARATSGSPMPVAASRHKASELPLTIRLDDSKSMIPSRLLSDFTSVQVTARISKSGDPIATTGDLQSRRIEVGLPSTRAITLTIDTIVE